MSRYEKQLEQARQVMADGPGEVCYASAEWVKAAEGFLPELVSASADELKSLGDYVLCIVTHNAPLWLRKGSNLAWGVRVASGEVSLFVEEPADDDCNFKIQGDHSILSNLSRIVKHDETGEEVAGRYLRQTRLLTTPDATIPPVLAKLVKSILHKMAEKTFPRYVFMTPEWAGLARQLISVRAERNAEGLKGVNFTFSEEMYGGPAWAFPDDESGGFWVRCVDGKVTIGSGVLPEEHGPADTYTIAPWMAVTPLGRTVNAVMTDEEKEEQAQYNKKAFSKDLGLDRVRVTQHSGDPMPEALSKSFGNLHDQLSKRTAGPAAADYDSSLPDVWDVPAFDRDPGYDKSWLKYDEVNIYGDEL